MTRIKLAHRCAGAKLRVAERPADPRELARYEAVIANRMNDEGKKKVTIAGKFCESGDILIKGIELPEITAGDILAVPDCGAYCLAMGSNYNASLKPAIVIVSDGRARLIRRRETYEDLFRHDVV